jgi:CBS domain-containing protein
VRHERIDPGQGPGDEGARWAEPIYVRDVMSRPLGEALAAMMSAPAASVGPGLPLHEALRLMTEGSIAAVPVVEEGRVIGIVTQSAAVAALTRRHSR